MKIKDIGRALMLPIAIFPLAAILMGSGYALERTFIKELMFLAVMMKTLGNVIITNMPLIFAVGVAYGLSEHHKGIAALNAAIAFQIVMALLMKANVSTLHSDLIIGTKDAFEHINNQFVGILCGVCSCQFFMSFYKHKTKFHKEVYAILLSSLCMMIVSLILYCVWPLIYELLLTFGSTISKSGSFGAGLYAFLNRLLIPLGMHHVLNSVFWFDVIGINDIGNFWTSKGVLGVTGMYQAGFYPIMMFAIPGIALAFYKSAYTKNKKHIKSFLISAVVASVFSGVTEPLEFSFMFVAPGLYVLHALLSGVIMYICASMQWIAGFSFSAGMIDFILSFQMPLANQPWMLLVFGVVVFFVYYYLFRFLIVKFHLPTIGRKRELANENDHELLLSREEINEVVKEIIDVCGGFENIIKVESCLTRLRIQVKDIRKIKQNRKGTKAVECSIFDNELQFVYGYQVDYIEDVLMEYRLNDK